MKRGPKPKPPVESPHWIAYEAALDEAIERFQSMPLAIKKLNGAFAAGKIQCKFESLDATEIVARAVPVTAEYYAPEERSQGDDEPEIHVNGRLRTGWLFLWKPDLIKYFDGGGAPTPAAAKTHETSAALGRPMVHDWIEITLIAVQLHHKFPEIRRTPLIRKLQDRLEDERIKAPALSELQKMVELVFARDKGP